MTNVEAQQAIVGRVRDEWPDVFDGSVYPVAGPLAVNHFSLTFKIAAEPPSAPPGVFVKVPKSDLRRRAPEILPVSEDDRRLADDEVASLRYLAERWRAGDLEVRWVRLRGRLPEFNALVTDRVPAPDATDALRRADLARRIGLRRSGEWIAEVLGRIGEALGRFHQAEAQPGVLDASSLAPRLLEHARWIDRATGLSMAQDLERALARAAGEPLPVLVVPTLKGLDIRNVLIDSAGRVTLLDPGRMKQTWREADLARFLMTVRILHWGRPWFALGVTPSQSAEREFLDRYYAASVPPSAHVLGWMFVKEILKHWRTALESLALKSWSEGVKKPVAAVYIDRFYRRQFARAMEALP